MFGIEAFLAVAVNLIECLEDCNTALFQLNLNHRNSVHKNRNIVAVLMSACLLKLPDYLNLVAKKLFIVYKIDVLNMSVVKDKIANLIVVNLARLVVHCVTGFVKVSLNVAFPFAVKKMNVVQLFNLGARI